MAMPAGGGSSRLVCAEGSESPGEESGGSRERQRPARVGRGILWRNAKADERIRQESFNRIPPLPAAENHKVEETANDAVVSRSNNRDMWQVAKTLNGR
jgi:hypothetical protein